MTLSLSDLPNSILDIPVQGLGCSRGGMWVEENKLAAKVISRCMERNETFILNLLI